MTIDKRLAALTALTKKLDAEASAHLARCAHVVDLVLLLHEDPDHRFKEVWAKIQWRADDVTPAKFIAAICRKWIMAQTADMQSEVAAARRMRDTISLFSLATRAQAHGSNLPGAELAEHLQEVAAATKFMAAGREDEKERTAKAARVPTAKLLEIRSDHGARSRTAFMRLTSEMIHRLSGEWHDAEVATLTDIAFPDIETTIDMVRSARKALPRDPK